MSCTSVLHIYHDSIGGKKLKSKPANTKESLNAIYPFQTKTKQVK